MSIHDPSPGVYWMSVCSQIGSTVVVSGETDLDFQHGFSELKPNSIEDTARQPIEGVILFWLY